MLLKNRGYRGVFTLPLKGPFTFVKYRNVSKTAADIKDKAGKLLSASTAHLIPFKVTSENPLLDLFPD